MLLTIYNFFASDFELPTKATDDDDNIKSYNELIALGYTKSQIQQQFGNILNLMKVDKNSKIFLILNDGESNDLSVYEDFDHSLARYYSNKKFIYGIGGGNESSSIYIDYLRKISFSGKEIELWHTWLDKYEKDEVEYHTIEVSNLTPKYLDDFFDYYTYRHPKVLTIKKEKSKKD